jgi:hypothetical protein
VWGNDSLESPKHTITRKRTQKRVINTERCEEITMATVENGENVTGQGNTGNI